ncbi:MAG: hypothetical protein ACP5H1_08430, partial [Acidilobus sp.]
GLDQGEGQDYALRRCPEGSYAAYFDLDDEYNAYFHRSIDWGMVTGIQRPLFYLTAKEFAVERGGWRDAGGTLTWRRTWSSSQGLGLTITCLCLLESP